MAVSIALSLLASIYASEYQESAVIKTLNDRYNFDHNLMLMDSSADINRFINVGRQVPLIPQSVFVHKNKNNPTRWSDVKQIRSTNPFTIVGLGKFRPKMIQKEFDNLLDRVKEIQRLKLDMKIGLFFADAISNDDLLELFKWFFDRRIINIFVACYGESSESVNVLNVFAFNPFGTFRALNVTASDYDKLFLSQKSNFQQHPLNVTYDGRIYYDPLLRVLFEGMNASSNMVVYESAASANDEEWNNNFLENSEIDFDTNVEPITVTNGFIYPIFKDKTVMIVPKSKPYPEFLAYLQLFTSTNVFIYIVFTITLTIVLLTLIRYKNDKEASLFKSGSDILYLLMNENGFITYQMRSLSEICLLVPLTFAGLIFVNGFMSILQSYLIQPVMQPQINTLEDIYKSNIAIYPDLEDLQNMFRKLTIYKGRKAAINLSYQSHRRGPFSGIFSESENFWREKEETEEKLGVRGFHISDVYLDESLYAYRGNDAFPFADRLNDIIGRLQCAGLIERWTRFTAAAPFTDNVEDRDKLLRDEVIFHYLSATDLSSNEEASDFPIFVIYGWGVSATVFFMEILFHFLSSNFSRIRRGLATGLESTKHRFQKVKERIFHLLRKL